MSTKSDVSLPPYPNEPLILQIKQARAPETAAPFWRCLALIGPNYFGRTVKSTDKAKIVRFYHLPEQTVDEQLPMPSTTSTFIDFYTVSVAIPEMWLVVLDLPDGGRLVIGTTNKDKYDQLKEDTDKPVSVRYQVGRFDGVPKPKSNDEFFLPPSPHHISDYQLIPR